MRVCLATVCIGDTCRQDYDMLFRDSHEAYANRHGYDYHVVCEFLTDTHDPALINMHKWMICGPLAERNYDYIVFVDADMLISCRAPPIHVSMDFGDKIGVVNQSQPTLEARHMVQQDKGYEVTAKEYYKKHANLDIDTDHIINSGCIVIQPKHHAEYLEKMVSHFYHDILHQSPGLHKDQPFFGYQLQKDEMCVFMDMKWNAIWANNDYYMNVIKGESLSIQQFYDTNYFVHFAGHCGYDLIPGIKKQK
jgi:hypothetical protein